MWKLKVWKAVFFLCAAILGAGIRNVHAQFGPPSPTALVQTVVSELQEDRLGIRSTFKITHVYSGPQSLLGTTVLGYTSKVGHSAGFFVEPAPKIGENGIWPLLGDSDALHFHLYDGDGLWSPFPVREGSPRFEQAKTLAQTIEKTEKVAPDKRLEAMQTLIFAPTPEIAAWAVHEWTQVNPEGAAKTLHLWLSNPQIAARARLVMGEELELLEPTWKNSPERGSLWQKCLEDTDSSSLQWILFKISNASNRGDLDGETFYSLLRTAIRNDKFSAHDREYILGLVRHLYDRGQLQKR